MKRLPLSDELPYEFIAPRLRRVWWRVGGPYARWRCRREHRVEAFEFAALDRLNALLATGDSVLITPNHADYADCFVLFEISRRLGRPFTYMAAHQVFTGLARWALPRVGVFSVDREGADRAAFKAAVDLLVEGVHPLVIFPEGEVYRLAERVTPLREGAFAIATAAARRLEEGGRRLWVVPLGIGYRFLEGTDPMPALRSLMGRLERRFTWRVQEQRPLLERLFRYADGVLSLKEVEYFGSPQSGSLADRVLGLTERVLAPIEARRSPGRRLSTIPERVKELRRACLEVLADPAVPSDAPAARLARADLEELFLAIQIFSYPGDYVRQRPSRERVAETLMKCEEDFLEAGQSTSPAPRRAIVCVGEPIAVGARADGGGRSRDRVAALAGEVERKLQDLLDGMPPGSPLADLSEARREALEQNGRSEKAGASWQPLEIGTMESGGEP